MLELHSVSKWVGRGQAKKLVLDRLACRFEAKTHYAILGGRGSGKTVLLNVLSGALVPTSGWVERRGIVSSTAGLVRFGAGVTTPRQLARRLANLYSAEPEAVAHFVERFSGLAGAMDWPTRFLTRGERSRLGLALFYGLPCDFYLYDRRTGTKLPDMKELVTRAYQGRREQAGVIFTTSQPKAALAFGGKGGILYKGTLTLYDTVEEAVEVFRRLEIVDQPSTQQYVDEVASDLEEIDDDIG